MAVFVMVVEEGSFRSAGDRMQLSPSVVSHHVSNLEARLDVKLLVRASRTLSLTSEGARLYQFARRMLTAAEEGLRAVKSFEEAPAGHITVSIAHFLSAGPVVPLIEEFLLTNPKVQLDLKFHDMPRHPVNDNFDLVISSENLSDTIVASTPLPVRKAGFYAAPDLANRIRKLRDKDVPQRIPLIQTAGFPAADWRRAFSIGMQQGLNFRLSCDDIGLAHKLCRSGIGMTVLPHSLVEEDVAAGLLEEVLPAIRFPQMELFANWSRADEANILTRAFVNHLILQLDQVALS